MSEADGELLRCPHFGCDTILPKAAPGETLRLCPTCHRSSARCLKETLGSLCPTLNRPLARYCRRCGTNLGPDWPGSAWEREAIPARQGSTATVASIGPAELIHTFEAEPYGPDAPGPIHLAVGGGALWIAGVAGPNVFRLPPGPGSPPDRDGLGEFAVASPPRMFVCGPWLVLANDRGLRGIDMVSDLGTVPMDEAWSFPIWTAGPGERLAAGPVAVEVDGDWMARDLIWLVAAPGGLRLGVARLPGGGPRTVAARVVAVCTDVGPIPSADTHGRPLILAGPWRGTGPVVLGSSEGFFVIDTSKDRLPNLTRVWDRPRADTHLPGLVVLPGDRASSGQPAPPYVFATYEDGNSHSMVILRPGSEVPHYCSPTKGVPAAVVRRGVAPTVLAVDGTTLRRFGLDGNASTVVEADALASAVDVQVHGRLALVTVVETTPTRRWLTLAFDLEAHRIINIASADSMPALQKLVTERAATGFAPLGRYLFRVASSRSGADESWCLERHAIRFDSVSS